MPDLLQEALNLYEQGDKNKAAQLLMEFLQTNPENASAWYGLALCVADVDLKIEYLQRVLQIDPQHSQASQLLAQTQQQKQALLAEKSRNQASEFFNQNTVTEEQLPPQNEEQDSFSPPKMSQKKIIFAVLSGLLAVCLICGLISMLFPKAGNSLSPTEAAAPIVATQSPDNPPPDTTQNSLAEIGIVGERMEQSGMALTVLSAERITATDDSSVKEGDKFLVLEVLIENTGRDEKMTYSPLYFSVKASNGDEYHVDPFTQGTSLQAGSLSKGDQARGFIVFEIPPTANDFLLAYNPMFGLGGEKEIKINLGVID